MDGQFLEFDVSSEDFDAVDRAILEAERRAPRASAFPVSLISARITSRTSLDISVPNPTPTVLELLRPFLPSPVLHPNHETNWPIHPQKYLLLAETVSKSTHAILRGPPLPYVEALLPSHPPHPPKSPSSVLPPTLWTTLKPFQRHGVEFALQHHGSFLLADDMGLGKTLQALATAACFRDEWPALVLAPTSLRETWREAIVKWLRPDRLVRPEWVLVLESARQAERVLGRMVGRAEEGERGRKRDPWDVQVRVDFVVVGYDLVPAVEGMLRRIGFAVVIADESHNLKNPETKRFKACSRVIAQARRRLLVSGTPALNRPAELFGQLTLLAPSVFSDFNLFSERYCGGLTAQHRGAENLSELYVLLSVFMKRRLKTEVIDLPPKHRWEVKVAASATLSRKISEGLQDLERIRNDFAGLSDSRPSNLIHSLMATTGVAKLPGVIARLSMLLRGNVQKLIVFGVHVDVLNGVENFVQKQGLGAIRIDGLTKPSERQALVDAFQADAEVRVAVLSLTAAGVGLTLTKADVVLFAELHWSPAMLAQAEDRAHRLGRDGPLEIEYALADNTLDDVMWPSIRRKLGIVGHCIDNAPELSSCFDPQGIVANIPEELTRAVVLGSLATESPTPPLLTDTKERIPKRVCRPASAPQ